VAEVRYAARMSMARALILVAVLLAPAASDAPAADLASAWTPDAWKTQDTLELQTTVPEEGDYWFPVWLVVLDEQVYVRLGTRAADRVEKSTTKPFMGVRIAGQQFDRVKAIPAPDKAEAVATAMGEKYWSDVFIRYFDHPLTLRLTPEPEK
jgi:hypothetical protein